MIGGIFDRYWMTKIAVRFAVIASIIPFILALENIRRLLADVQHSSDAMLLLVRLTVALIPEHLSISVPVALMLASALAVRQMTMRGEWQIAAAAGMSRLRIMAAPLVFALLVAGAQFAIAFELRPAGERAIYTIYSEMQAGAHGLPVPVGEPIALDTTTTLFVGGIGRTPERHLEEVVVRRGTDNFSAPRADIGFAPDGSVRIQLHSGVAILGGGTDRVRAVHFDRMDFTGRPAGIGMVDQDKQHELDRLSGSDLLKEYRNGAPIVRQYALTALVMRMDSVLFCLFIPWIAIPLGKPARRKEGAVGVLVSIVLVVVHLKLAASIESHFSAHILLAESLALCGWAAVAAGLTFLESAHGEGAIDSLASQLTTGLGRLRKFRRRTYPALRTDPVRTAASVRPEVEGNRFWASNMNETARDNAPTQSSRDLLEVSAASLA